MSVVIRVGHVMNELAALPAESIHCVWTSVPYWGLRAYGTVPQIWSGDPDCDHDWQAITKRPRPSKGSHGATSIMVTDSRSIIEAHVGGGQATNGPVCSKCGAYCGEHGLEPTLDLWLRHEVLIWQAIKRVLRKDGTAWLNCGDAYAGSVNGRAAAVGKEIGTDDRTFRDKPLDTAKASGLKDKQRLMMPARLALALQADGWWIRDEIVWAKTNPMPSSVPDRTSPAHEMVYLLTKSARYYFDNVAIKEPLAETSVARLSQPSIEGQMGDEKALMFEAAGLNERSGSRQPTDIVKGMARNMVGRPRGWDTAAGSHSTLRHTTKESIGDNKFGSDDEPNYQMMDRNKRSVWSLATEPFKKAHFATAPTELVKPCILSGTSAGGCCRSCGKPFQRVVRSRFVAQQDVSAEKNIRNPEAMDPSRKDGGSIRGTTEAVTIGWWQACKCEPATPVPCRVLDPFGGSGTTALVANWLGRDAILIELKPEYAEMARERLTEDMGFMANVKMIGPEAA